MPTSARRPRSRRIDIGAISQQGVSLPESWLRGILAGAEGILGTWILMVVPAIAVYIATAAAPELGSASWVEAAQLGTGAWLAAHGAQLQVGEVTFTLLPLGITLTAIALSAAAIRRAALETWAGPIFAVGTYVVGTALLTTVVDVPGATRAIGGALVVSLLAAIAGMRRNHPPVPPALAQRVTHLREAIGRWVHDHPRATTIRAGARYTAAACRAGAATSLRALAGMAIASLIAVIIAAAGGMELMRAVHERLDADLVSTIVLTGAQVLFLPTAMVWAASYLSGAGFTLGQGTLYSPGEVISAPLPALPMLGALPNPESSPMPLLGYTFLVVGAVCGWYMHRRLSRHYHGEAPPGVVAGAVGFAVVLTAAAAVVLAALTTGGFGPGRFATEVGPVRGAFIASVVWQIGASMAVVALVAHPALHRALGAGWAKLRALTAPAQ